MMYWERQNRMMGRATFPRHTARFPFLSATELLEAYKAALAELRDGNPL